MSEFDGFEITNQKSVQGFGDSGHDYCTFELYNYIGLYIDRNI